MVEWREIEQRGYKLLVSSDAQIVLPAKETTFLYTRFGKTEERKAVFKERVLKQCVQSMGYMEVSFVHQRKTFKFLVHRLVAMAFVKGYAEGLTVNHKNGNKTDNRPENLEWVSKGDNTRHAWRTGLVSLRGEDQPGAKLNERRVREIKRLLAKGISAHSISIVADVSSSLIDMIRDGKRWGHVN